MQTDNKRLICLCTRINVYSFHPVIIVSIIALWSPDLPWRSGVIRLPLTYMVAVWASMIIGILFIALFVQWVAEQARQLSAALVASQMALEREQRMSAVGGLAAAAAHELGTPLSTMAVVAKELAYDLPKGSMAQSDAEVLLHEIDRCKSILQRLQTTPDRVQTDPSDPFSFVPLTTLVEVAAQPFLQADKQFSILADSLLLDEDGLEGEHLSLEQLDFDQPKVPRSPALVYGLGNLLQNALQFAKTEVTVYARWDDKDMVITIHDDGPGIDPAVLPHLGEAHVGPSRRRSRRQGRANQQAGGYAGLGLGVFIAQTLISSMGGHVQFSNNPAGGAIVEVTLDRALANA